MRYIHRLYFVGMLAALFSCKGSAKVVDGGVFPLAVCGREVKAELALSDASRSRGYMYREKAPRDDEGMLFVFSDEVVRQFWMANVAFPLDILFMDRKGVVVKILTMKTHKDVPLERQPRYPSEVPARFALEVHEGWAKKHGITLGCEMKIPKELQQTN